MKSDYFYQLNWKRSFATINFLQRGVGIRSQIFEPIFWFFGRLGLCLLWKLKNRIVWFSIYDKHVKVHRNVLQSMRSLSALGKCAGLWSNSCDAEEWPAPSCLKKVCGSRTPLLNLVLVTWYRTCSGIVKNINKSRGRNPTGGISCLFWWAVF